MIKNAAQKYPRDLGVMASPTRVFLYSNLSGKFGNRFHVGASVDGLSFKDFGKVPSLVDSEGKHEEMLYARDFRISSFGKEHILLYKTLSGGAHLSAAKSSDGVVWKKIGTVHSLHDMSMLIPNYKYEGYYVAYTGEGDIKLAISKDLKVWKVNKEALLTPRKKHFDNFPIEVGTVMMTERGILLIYFTKIFRRENEIYTVGAALFDKDNPARMLWRSEEPVWKQPVEWGEKQVYPVGALKFKEKFILYFGIEGEGVTAVAFSNFEDVFNLTAKTSTHPVLKKHMENPIISPAMRHSWENMSTFNPAAVYEDGKVHLLYRAQGESNTSTLGYATSKDGVTIDERLKEPVYWPTQPFETPGGVPFHPNISFMSAGGWGGCEDPRLTKVDDKFYLTYVAYNGRAHLLQLRSKKS